MKSSLRLVVVDHDAFVCDAICTLLDAHGFAALPIHDAQSARSVVQRRAVDIALVEVRLQRESGVALAEHFRSIGIPTILMSGLMGTEPELADIAQPLLCKPFRFHDLLEVIGAQPWQSARRGPPH